jgi:hypothetical protein
VIQTTPLVSVLGTNSSFCLKLKGNLSYPLVNSSINQSSKFSVAVGPNPAWSHVSSLMSVICYTTEHILREAVLPISFIEKAGSNSTKSTVLLLSISLLSLTASFSDCNASIIISSGSS